MRQMEWFGPGVIALVGMALFAGGASAQIAPGQSGISTQQSYTGQVVWNELTAFGRCYATGNRKGALQLLSTRPGTREEIEIYKKLFGKTSQSCLGSITRMNVPYQLVRGAIAEGLYEKSVPVPSELAFSGPLEKTQIRDLSDAARCYAAANATKVRSLLSDTKLGSESEAAAIQAMLPGFEQCIPEGARRLEVNPMLIRARLAEALWRLNASPAASAKAN